MKKVFLTAFVAAAFAFGMASCNNNAPAEQTTDTTEVCCEHEHECCQHSNCVFLCCELYGKKSGYEIHMLLAMPSGLKYLTVGAADIEVINNAECCTESTEK